MDEARCTCITHQAADGTRWGYTVWDCEQYIRHTENAGGTGQWLLSVKLDHRLTGSSGRLR